MALLPQDQGGRHPPHFSSWKMETQTGAETCSRPPRWTGPGPGPQLGARGGAPGLMRVGNAWRSRRRVWRMPRPFPSPRLPRRPAPSRRPAPAGSGKGAGLPGAADTSPRQRGHTGQPTAWGCARPGGQSGHGQPLRGGGGRLPGPGVSQQKGTWRRLRRPDLGAHGGLPGDLRPYGEGDSPRALPAPEMPARSAPSRPGGDYTSQEPVGPAQGPRGAGPRPPAGWSRPRATAQGRSPGRTGPQDSVPPGTSAPRREPKGPQSSASRAVRPRPAAVRSPQSVRFLSSAARSPGEFLESWEVGRPQLPSARSGLAERCC